MNFKVPYNPFYDYKWKLFLQHSSVSFTLKFHFPQESIAECSPTPREPWIQNCFMETKNQPNLPSSD